MRHPECLIEAWTVLIPPKRPVSSNYHLITCLIATWNLPSGIIAGKMNRDLTQYMTQKGHRKELAETPEEQNIGYW